MVTTTSPASRRRAGAPRWSEFPAAVKPDSRDGQIAGALLAAGVVTVPAAVRASVNGGPDTARVAVVAVIGAALTALLLRGDRSASRVGVALGAVLAATITSRSVGLSLVLGAASVAGLSRDDARHPEATRRRLVRPLDLRLAGPTIATTTLAALLASTPDRPSQMLAAQVLGLLVAHAPEQLRRAAGTFGAAVGRVAAAAGRAVTAACALDLGLVTVVVPWVAGRLMLSDPTWARTASPSSQFVPRHVQLTPTRRNWIPRTSLLRQGLARRLRSAAAVVAVIALVTVGVRTAIRFAAQREPLPTAMSDAPWWRDAYIPQSVTFNEAEWWGFVGPVLADLRSPTTNVVDGRRVTWHPPADSQMRIWFFGGSTAFGLGQRDDHTIASELARAAWERGIAVEVTNFGVHADVLWMEHRRLRAAIEQGMEPPDIALFYDGYNELATYQVLNVQGRARSVPYTGTFDTQKAFDAANPWRSFLRLLDPNAQSHPVEPPDRVVLDDDDVTDLAVRQYRESVRDTARYLEQIGVQGAFVHQPSVATRAKHVRGEPQLDARARAQPRRFAERLPRGVEDLSGVFDDEPGAIYWDLVHTNERGARIVGEALVETYWPLIRQAADAP